MSLPVLSWCDFEALTLQELYALLQLRQDVFVVEQTCVLNEIDGRDPEARHALLWHRGALAGTARLFAPDAVGNARLGRIVVAREARGQGLGRHLVAGALQEVGRRWGAVPVEMGAQKHLQDFYRRFGFVTVSGAYDDHGILHVLMRRPPPV